MAADPVMRAAQRAGVRRWINDPANRAAHVERCIRNGKMLTPAQLEARRAWGRERAADLRAACAKVTPDERLARGQKRTDTVLAWCPPEWRAKYRDLKKRGRRAADAKRIVLDLIAGRPEPEKYSAQRAKLNWCPAERRDEYRDLCKRWGAGEARRRIEATMTSFECQLAKVAAGARLITVQPIRRADPSFTLGGVSAAF